MTIAEPLHYCNNTYILVLLVLHVQVESSCIVLLQLVSGKMFWFMGGVGVCFVCTHVRPIRPYPERQGPYVEISSPVFVVCLFRSLVGYIH